MTDSRPPLPPFTLETAKQKVQAAEDAWNTRDLQRVSLAYTVDSQWRYFGPRPESDYGLDIPLW
jgi:nuclear transport factor 2 (NTF2) superfamily protein